jgi:ribosome-binding protein aMBF1 (putative translation factor)
MSRVCEICGRLEEDASQANQEETASSEMSMSILHVCEECIKDRQYHLS